MTCKWCPTRPDRARPRAIRDSNSIPRPSTSRSCNNTWSRWTSTITWMCFWTHVCPLCPTMYRPVTATLHSTTPTTITRAHSLNTFRLLTSSISTSFSKVIWMPSHSLHTYASLTLCQTVFPHMMSTATQRKLLWPLPLRPLVCSPAARLTAMKSHLADAWPRKQLIRLRWIASPKRSDA